MKRTNLTAFKAVIALAIGLITGTVHATNVAFLNTYSISATSRDASGCVTRLNPLTLTATSTTGTTKEYTLYANETYNIFPPLFGFGLGDIDKISSLTFKAYKEAPIQDLGTILAKIKAEKNNHNNADVIINLNRIHGENDPDWEIRLFWQAK